MIPQKRQELSANWRVLVAAMCGVMLGVGAVPIYILGPISKTLQADFGWHGSDVITTISFLAAGMALSLPFVGSLCDRNDARRLALLSVALLAFLFVLVPSAAELGAWGFHLVYFVMGLTTAMTSGILYVRVVSASFDAARGFALGCTLAGSGIASFLAPLYVHWVTAAAGWQFVYYGLAAAILLVSTPILYFGFAHAQQPALTGASRSVPEPAGVSLSEAFRNFRLYLMLASLVLMGTVIGTLLIDLVPALIDRGMSPGRAVQIASLLGVSLIIGRLGCGWLIDRFSPGLVGGAAFIVAAIGVTSFFDGGYWSAITATIAIGAVNGAEMDLISFMTVRYFGLRHYGRIFGFCYGVYMAVAVVGPFVGSALIEHGGHNLLFAAASGVFMTIACCMLALGRSDERSSRLLRTDTTGKAVR